MQCLSPARRNGLKLFLVADIAQTTINVDRNGSPQKFQSTRKYYFQNWLPYQMQS